MKNKKSQKIELNNSNGLLEHKSLSDDGSTVVLMIERAVANSVIEFSVQ